jgi:hypothetical protein
MTSKTLLMISSSIELATGIAIIASPRIVAGLLLSAELTPGGVAIARVGGCGLVSLAIACWPRSECLPQNERDHEQQPIRALFLYNLLAACYLAYLEIGGDFANTILLAAATLHGLLALLFIRPVYDSVIGKAHHTPNTL